MPICMAAPPAFSLGGPSRVTPGPSRGATFRATTPFARVPFESIQIMDNPARVGYAAVRRKGEAWMRGPRIYGHLKLASLIMLAMIGLADVALAQTASSGLPLAPGDIINGPVFRRNGTSVPSISSGADANTYLNLGPPTESFTPSAPAVVIRTSVPTQYVRVFTAGVTNPVGGFIAASNTVRGLNASQIRDVLALPNLPDSLTIVQIPASTCMI